MSVLVLGSQGGISAALCRVLRVMPTTSSVVALGRREGFDMRAPAIAEAALMECANAHGPFSMVVDATGILESAGGGQPEKSIREIDAAHMADMFAVNTIGPALVLKHFAKLAPRPDKKKDAAKTTSLPSCVFATLSARVGSISDNGLGGWISYRASKAALNQVVRTASIELGRTHPSSVCVAIHPGTVQTSLSSKYVSGTNNKHNVLSPDDSAQRMVHVLQHLTPADTGKFLAYDGKEIPW